MASGKYRRLMTALEYEAGVSVLEMRVRFDISNPYEAISQLRRSGKNVRTATIAREGWKGYYMDKRTS